MNDSQLLDQLPRIASAATHVEGNLQVWLQRARGRKISWSRIGQAVGIVRQSAWKRFHREEVPGRAGDPIDAKLRAGLVTFQFVQIMPLDGGSAGHAECLMAPSDLLRPARW